jgi:predicted PurR-regulated permease PerM
MVAFYLLFLFIEDQKLPKRIAAAFHPATADDTRRVGRTINSRIQRYLQYKTYVSLGLGASTGLLCWLLGLDFWLLWAVLMFLLNYVTYVGSIVALLPPVALAFLQHPNPAVGLGLALLLTLNRIFWIDYVEIRALGNVLNLSPLVLLLSIAYFGFIWGPVGLLLAVPLVTTVKIILSDFEATHPLAVLISEE